MKNLKRKLFLVTVLLFAINLNAQEYLVTSNTAVLSFLSKDVTAFNGTPLISNKTFSYRYNRKKVDVVYKGDVHYEYYDNKKYYIKSKLFWVSESLVYLTIEEATLPGFPFKKGTKMKIKITKIEDGYVYYTSTLAGKSWEGKMKENKL